MTATWKWYGNGLRNALLGNLRFGTDTFKLMLTSDLYVPNKDTHEFRSSVTNEVAPSGTYAAGGVTVTGVVVSYDAPSDQARVAFADTVIDNCTITCRTAVLYKSSGNAATDILVAYATEATNIAAVNGSLTLDQAVPCLFITAV